MSKKKSLKSLWKWFLSVVELPAKILKISPEESTTPCNSCKESIDALELKKAKACKGSFQKTSCESIQKDLDKKLSEYKSLCDKDINKQAE